MNMAKKIVKVDEDAVRGYMVALFFTPTELTVMRFGLHAQP